MGIFARLRIGMSSAMLVVVLSFSAQAQTPAGALSDLSILVGERVQVTRSDGSRVTGQLMWISDRDLAVKDDQGAAVVLPVGTVVTVSRWQKDSLANGIAIGAGIGLGIGVASGALSGPADPSEPVMLYTVGPGILIGLAAGALVDAMRHKKVVVYTAAPPAPGRAAPVAVTPTPKIEVSAAVGMGGMMGDESYEGSGLAAGAAVSARVWRRIWLGFSVDQTRTQRDFSSDVHWKDDSTLFTGSLAYRFSRSRLQPFAELLFGGARVHHTRSYPTYTRVSGPPGLIKGPDAVTEGITTATTWGIGGGVLFYLTPSVSIGAELRSQAIAGVRESRTLTQGLFRFGYGWGREPATVVPTPASLAAPPEPAPRAVPAGEAGGQVVTRKAVDVTEAQPPSLAARIVPGIAYEIGMFGDDSPRSSSAVGITIAGHVWKRWSDSKALVVEVAFQPTALQNPWFDEAVRVLYLQVGPEFGRRTYVRPSGGIGLQFWSGSRTETSTGVGLALGVAVGHRVPLGARYEMSPEVFWRASASAGIVTPSYGVQVPIGRRVR